MRSLLLVSLLALSFGLTAVSLVAVRFTLHRQIQRDLSSDLQHSVDTFLNLENQRREMLARETALLADLPSLKALMTTQDARTIQDGGKDFWEISGSDLFQLYDRSGHLVASYRRGLTDTGKPGSGETDAALHEAIELPDQPGTLPIGGKLYEVVAQPLSFGSRVDGTFLGYVVLGSAIDQRVAQEVSQAAAAEVAFTIGAKVAVTTLKAPLAKDFDGNLTLRGLQPGQMANVTLGNERYLAKAMTLCANGCTMPNKVHLVVLRSYESERRLGLVINRWLVGLGMLALVLGTLIADSISRRVTRPLEALVDGARALGRGDFTYKLPGGGTAEIRELTRAFDHMRGGLETSQRALVDSERLATIGRMASSISHDLRHYISAIYANAEFLSLEATPQVEREELIFEVQTAVHGMTDLLDSLLGFSKTGRSLLPSYESIPYLVERAAGLLRAHPEARAIELRLDELPSVEAWVDATKFVRAVFNLLLNACQAARRGGLVPAVTVELSEDEKRIVLKIIDNGLGVPASFATTIFEPFVSTGRENGTGLGLTLAQHIAQEHGGMVRLEESAPGRTVFTLSLYKEALNRLRETPVAVALKAGSQETAWRDQ
ncbi:ATP-binding protein [Granulicella tundricola]|uniref:histidine kinase n=1 Tax=Granulicella tundricola (strain ATCC BAA-1859 / DSM 23138 / MP5ACTX9) TaxID=1198114 RepID=E8WZ64_GRATM|nr:ATP-binding protein [Granulicella tundricola]ADW67666.1 integral membrane sensor signal transduction histidine kinase [Granulicella tundricola MP5ACTX9]